MANHDILAIGTSAGGVKALLSLAKRFSSNFPAAVLVTIHLGGQRRSILDEILTSAGPLPAMFAAEGVALENGRIFIAPPERHLLVEGERLTLGHGPRENNVRPAIDPMLRSVAACCGHRAIGVVLTGTQGDGASGLRAVRECGGIAVVQDPRDADFPEMPDTALNHSNPNHVVSLEAMPALLENLVRQPAGKPVPTPAKLIYEVSIAKSGGGSMKPLDQIGRRSVLACPDCHGVMWEIEETDLLRYRCHVGHAYTAEVMNLALEENLRRAFASALRALEERAALVEKLRRHASDRGHDQTAKDWASRKTEYEAEANVIREAVRRIDELGRAA